MSRLNKLLTAVEVAELLHIPSSTVNDISQERAARTRPGPRRNSIGSRPRRPILGRSSSGRRGRRADVGVVGVHPRLDLQATSQTVHPTLVLVLWRTRTGLSMLLESLYVTSR
jgi:hypothetical protein